MTSTAIAHASPSSSPAAATSIQSVLNSLSLEDKVGQLFLLGFNGTDANNAAPIIDELHPGGIVFLENATSAADARRLTTTLQQSAHADGVLPLLFAIDQEGGQVQRLHTDFSQFPANWVSGHLGPAEALTAVCQQGGVQGRELAQAGIQMNLAPVMDVLDNPANTVIGDRSYSSDAATVARLGTAYIQALQATGTIAVAKHFPGHGSTTDDSHLTLPLVTYDRAWFDAHDLVPFRAAIATGVRGIMIAHISYTGLDAVPNRPATLSPAITTDLLRRQLGFENVILTDDLGAMKAITANFTPEEAAVQAVEAGADLLTVSGPGDTQRRMVAGVRAAVGTIISESQLDQAVQQVLIAKDEAGLLGKPQEFSAASVCRA